MRRTEEEVRHAINVVIPFFSGTPLSDFGNGALEILQWSLGKTGDDLKKECVKFQKNVHEWPKGKQHLLGRASALAWLLGEEPKGFKNHNP